jgi:TonB family protein
VFPTFNASSDEDDVRRPRVYKLQQVLFETPEPQVRRSIPKPKARRIPIPDPTPDDPEPIVLDDEAPTEDLPEFDIPAMDASTVWIPDAPPGPAIGPVRVEGDVLAPKRVFAPQPEYPEEARLARVQGVVILETIIDTLGAVTKVKVLKGLPAGLTEAAVKAVSDWRFNPAMLNGEPVAVYYLVTVSFTVQ